MSTKILAIVLISAAVIYMAATAPFGQLTVVPLVLGLLIVFALAYDD